MDALGLATVDSLTSAAVSYIPFGTSFSFSALTDEDITNLKTLRRLLLLLSGFPSNESLSQVNACTFYTEIDSEIR